MKIGGYIALFVIVISCRSEHGMRVTRIGNYSLTPFSIVNGDVFADDGSQVQRLGPDGTVKWRSNARGAWAIPHGGASSAFVVTESDSGDKASLLEVDLATGISRSRSTVRPRAFVKWYRIGDALIVANLSSLERINPDTGDELWRESGSGSPLNRPGINDIWVRDGFKLVRYSVADGGQREMAGGTWASITPDGRTLVTEFGADIAAFDTQSLQRVWTHVGDRNMAIAGIAASDRWIVVDALDRTSSRHTVTVHRRSDGRPMWSRRSAKDAYFGYIAAGGDLIAYYDSSDSSLHAVHMPDATSAVVYRFEGGIYISTERAGVAPAVPDEPPIIDGEVIIVSDYPIRRAYRVTM